IRIGNSMTPLLMAAPEAVTYQVVIENPDQSETLDLLIPEPVSPWDMTNGASLDRRALGLALTSVRIRSEAAAGP
ncbi:DUF7024 domain-containing protein, partial [Streptomyces scabiei]